MKKYSLKHLEHVAHKQHIMLKMKLKEMGYRFYREPQPDKWVFLLGCYNSGTTLLHNIIAQHHMVGSMPKEGRNFTNELTNAVDFGLPRLWALKPELFYLDETSGLDINVSKIKRQWAFMYNHPDRPVLIEKSIVNAGRVKWLNKNFKNAHFISLVRNGYAVSEGIRRKAGHNIEMAASQWSVSNDIMQKDLNSVENKINIQYEELTHDPVNTLNRIFDFIQIPHLPIEIIEKDFRIHERTTSIENFNKTSFKNLTDDDIDIINRVAGDVMKKLGYELITPQLA